jgi:hypothetical protein
MKHLFRVATVAFLCVILFTVIFRPEGGAHDGPYSVEELREDFAQLRSEIESCHPKLYAFAAKDELERAFDDGVNRLNRPMNLEEFYSIVMPLVAKIGCGHARVYTPEGYWAQVPDRLFPLELLFVSGGAFAVKPYADTTASPSDTAGVPPGSRILSINGLSIDEITQTMKSAISADGYNDSWKTYKLNTVFAYMYAILYGYPENFVVEFSGPGAERPRSVSLAPVSVESVQPSPDRRMATGEWTGGDLGFEIMEEQGAAVMTFKTFGYYDDRETFYAFVDDAFERVKAGGIKKLVLDFRGNDGGDPFCTVHLLSYIADRPVRYFAKEYRQYEKFAQPIPLAEERFEGDLAILIDGGCYSSTGHLCAVLDYNEIGTFAGVETGGTYTCNDASKSFTLKNTRYRVNMPRMTFEAAVSGMPPDRGILPHHHVEPRIDDLIRGRDTAREFALQLLR